MVACFFVALIVLAKEYLNKACTLHLQFQQLRDMLVAEGLPEQRGGMVMSKKKSIYSFTKIIRGVWAINPRTRVQENNAKNKKKRRQEEKKMTKDDYPSEYK